jgi:hypothetical protein
MNENGEGWIVVDSPESRGRPVVERRDEQFQGATAPERRVPCEETTRDRHGRAAQEETRPARLPPPRLVIERPLQ